MMPRTLTGRFLVEQPGAGTWRLRNLAPPHQVVHLRGVPPQSGALEYSSVTIDWRSQDVRVSLGAADGERVIPASSALVHELREQLYDLLPLESFDERARRFWRRVFALVRIPGGRFLIARLARRRRGFR